MSLEKELIELSHLNPQRSAALTVLHYEQIVTHYKCEPQNALDYLRHLYTSERPRPFSAWFADQPKAPPKVYNPGIVTFSDQRNI